jgi:hypothetical protein
LNRFVVVLAAFATVGHSAARAATYGLDDPTRVQL